jgi:hypothetical protein
MQGQRRGGQGIRGGRIMRRLLMVGEVCRETVVYRGLLAVISVVSLS